MKKVAFVLTFAILASPAVSAPSGGRPETIFQCSFGKKQVLVKKVGPLFIYSFGLPGRPEVEVVADPNSKNLTASNSVGTLDMIRQIRIRNGRHSYVVFYEGLTDAYATPRASSGSGLAVFEGTKRISKFECKSGSGFREGWDPSDLPEEDPFDYDISS